MDDRHSKKHSKRDKHASRQESHPSFEEKEAMTASLEKARLKEVGSTHAARNFAFCRPACGGFGHCRPLSIGGSYGPPGLRLWGPIWWLSIHALQQQRGGRRGAGRAQQVELPPGVLPSSVGFFCAGLPCPILRPLLPGRRVWPRPSRVYGQHERDFIPRYGTDGTADGRHVSLGRSFCSSYPVVCWSG
jgi:hypothetical protein